MSRITLLSLFLVAIATSTINAQDIWQNFTNGGSVEALLETETTIWVGTQGGLIQMDPITEEMTFWNHANSGLAYNWVTSLAWQQEINKLWIGTRAGLTIFDGTWHTFYSINSELPGDFIQDIAIAPNGTVWIAINNETNENTRTGVLVKIDGEIWTIFDASNSDLPADEITAITADEQGRIWVGTYSSGLFQYDGQTWFNYTSTNSDLPLNYVSDLVTGENGSLWIGGYGVTMLNGDEWTVYTPENSLLPDATVTTLTRDTSNNLWIGTTNNVVKFDGQDWTIYPTLESRSILYASNGNLWVGNHWELKKFDGVTWTTVHHANSPLESGNIYGFATDSTNQLWFIEQNVEQYETQTILFTMVGDEWIPYVPDAWNALSRDVVIDQNDAIWIATTSQGLARFDGSVWNVYHIGNSEIPDNELQCLAVDSTGQIWVGTRNNGLAVFDGTDWVHYQSSNSDLPNNHVTALAVGTTGVWIGTEQGLARFDGQNWDVYTTSNSNLPDDYIRSLVVDFSGNVWIGPHDSGLASFDGATWSIYNSSNSALPDNRVNTLGIDDDGSLWIGTHRGGLAKFTGSEWTIYNLHNSGLADNFIRSLHIDPFGNKWIGTAGLTIFNEGGIMAVEDEDTPETAATVSFLQQNYPNPFNPSTTIAFNLPSKQALTLRIYNTAGQLVKTLLDGTHSTPAGTHEVTWDGRNEHGLPVSSGVYFYRLEAGSTNSPFEGGQGDVIQTRRMVLLR